MATLPPLGPLISFHAASRHNSFTKAAHELHLTHGAISRAVRQLEEHFGFALFHRGSRGVRLTSKGREFAEHVQGMLSDLESACEALRTRGAKRRLSVSCEPSLAMRWLMPRLGTFHRLRPDADIHLSTEGGPIDLSEEGAHIAVRRSDFAWPPHYNCHPLGKESVGPVCTPGYWAKHRHGPVKVLHTRTRPDAWAHWRKLAQVDITASAERIFDHFYFSLQAATAGIGMAVGPEPLVRDDIAQGVLTAPFGFARTPVEYVALTIEKPYEDSPSHAFIAWLDRELALPRG